MSSPCVVALLLCVLLPLSGLAQTAEPATAPPPPLVQAPEKLETAPAQSTSEVPRDALIPRSLPEKTGSEEWRSHRIPLQILGGSAGVGVGMLLAVGIISLDKMNCDGPCNYSLIFLGLGVGAGGITLGPTLAVWGIGEALDDRGRFWPTLAGATLGAISSVVAQTQLNTVSDAARIAVFGFGPLLGTLVAYELTRRGPLLSEPEASSPQVLPVVGMSPGGGLVGGLVGRF